MTTDTCPASGRSCEPTWIVVLVQVDTEHRRAYSKERDLRQQARTLAVRPHAGNLHIAG